MRDVFLILVLGLVTSVASYGIAGCNERLWYYHAYTLDNPGGLPKWIGVKCRGTAGKNRCTLQEFIQYFEYNKKDRAPLPKKNLDVFNIPRTVSI
jgi:hypothetical protein